MDTLSTGISREQALDCFASDDLIGIGMEADAVRRRLHPAGVVTYALACRIALAQPAGSIEAAITAALEDGCTGVTLIGAESLSLEAIEATLRAIKGRHPALQLQALSVQQIDALAASSGLSLGDLFARLRAAGLDCLPGHPAERLDVSRWLEIHRAAHAAGIATLASMTFGAGETMEERVAFLEAVRMLQEETHGFNAFSLFSHHTPGGRDLDDPTAVEYLKTLAICRMMLDNIPHLESNWEQQGLKVLQMGLRFGGNDAGTLLAGSALASEEEVRRIIRDAGFQPVQRDTLHRTHFLP
jgi:cyclic dehypoxanthinyl futalosine synthase